MDPITNEKAEELLKGLEEWEIVEGKLEKGYEFDSFTDALEFVVDIGGVAEEMEHHPEILLAYNTVDVTLWTHSANGLTEKDFELAKRIDEIEDTDSDEEDEAE